MPAGKELVRHTLHNRHGMEVTICSLGGIVQRLTAPDREGRYEDVVLGFDAAKRYRGDHPYFGAIVGRYGNRIRNGRFVVDGDEYELARNAGSHHLHGGPRGFDTVGWHMEEIASERGRSLKLGYVSPDGDQGYPGELDVSVIYTLTEQDALRIDYQAITNRPTPVNLTNHSYFNLAGQAGKSVEDHQIQILASRYTPVDAGLIPTGEICAVADTPFDFLEPRRIGERIDDENEQLQFGGGYDHNWVFDKDPGALELVATVTESTTGRLLEVYTTEPGVQFYTANSLDGSITGKGGYAYARRSGFCLETQHFPDSPNQPGFPSTILRPDEVYRTTTVYRFSTS